MARKEHPQSRGMDKRDSDKSSDARKVQAAAASRSNDTETFVEKCQRIAAAVLDKIGTPTVGIDGETYVVAESLRIKIAEALLAREPNDEGLHFNVRVEIDEWWTVPPCPVQRDTAERWNRRAEDLVVLKDAHKDVTIAVQENGDVYILDAHTRTYGWRNKLVPESEIPTQLNCTVRCTKNKDGTIAEYNTIDSIEQSKRGPEQFVSECRANDFVPLENGFVRRGINLIDALKVAFDQLADAELVNKSMLKRATETRNLKKRCRPTLSECVKRFKPALKALDKLNPKSGKKAGFSAAVVRAFLLSYVKYTERFSGDNAEDKLLNFFAAYRDGMGTSKDGKFDALASFRAVNREDSGAEAQRKDKTPRLLGAIERYIENGPNKMYSQSGAVNMDEYFASRTALSRGARHRRGKGGNETTDG
jgi:hypothetical protein